MNTHRSVDERSPGDGPAERARRLFRTRYAAEPELLWSAPGRVNLIGEHTDYNDGLVLPFALPHRTVVAVGRRGDGLLALASAERPDEPLAVPLDRLAPGEPGGWGAYPAGVLWALREDGHRLGGVSVAVASDVPPGAGLSSSAALEVASAGAFGDLFRLGLDGRRLAAAGRRAEHAFAGVPCGVMDQLASACCRPGHALLLDTRELGLRHIPFAPHEQGLALLVADTRVNHRLAEGGYADRRAGCEAAAAVLGVPSLREVPVDDLPERLAALPAELLALARHVVTENERVRQMARLLEAGRLRESGPLLVAGHVSLRDDFAVSCPELDSVVDAALRAGALGARMTGGGFGGSAVVLAETDAVDAVSAAVRTAARAAGHPEPRIFRADPAAGAHRS
ncbi:galactokinase [Streptomyces sp. SM12]|uniref:galactokinase n=1 Tax=Streptomyces sp. SM12 TaxID=1071602 RepID=UPI0021560CD5|nr:galactokinase [Streptomyces sp. SM12]